MTASRPDSRVRRRYRYLPFTGALTPDLGRDPVSKEDCPGCVALRDADSCGRFQPGWCGEECLVRLDRQIRRG